MRPQPRYLNQTGPHHEQDEQEQQDETAYWNPGQVIPTTTTAPLDSYNLDYDEGQCQEKLWNDIKSLVTGEFLKFEHTISVYQ